MADQLSSDKLLKLKDQILAALVKTKSKKDLGELRVLHLGRKSALTALLKELPQLAHEDKRKIGALANQIKSGLEAAFGERERALIKNEILSKTQDKADLTLPGFPYLMGHRHPLNIIAERIHKVLELMGFRHVEGSEIESDENNFTLLNIPQDHPARDMQDTFYIKGSGGIGQGTAEGKWLLRTHTTPVWIPVMRGGEPPYRVWSSGKVFRRDAVDATHLPFFHQIDAFAVDQHLSLADLKSTLEIWAGELFGSQTKIRFRPSYFSFTEPSCEVEVQCFICAGQGCPSCKNGWLEMLGAGMIHPEIIQRLGHDPEKWRGFAFGLGLERVAMVAFGIPDIRMFYENDMRFLEQFSI